VTRVWIFNKQGQILWLQRSLQKKAYPGYWDTCSGHVGAGDLPDSTVIREVEEELGIENAHPVFIEKYYQYDVKHNTYYYLYYLVCDKPSDFFKADPSEIEQLAWIDVAVAMRRARENEVKSTDFLFFEVPQILQNIFSKTL